MRVRTSALGVALLALGSSTADVSAQAFARPHPTPSATAQGRPHRFFGTLQTINGQLLTLRLRNGRLLRVDATRAFALVRVSEPLFRGKPTVIDGSFGPSGVFFANTVKRGAALPANWGLDQ